MKFRVGDRVEVIKLQRDMWDSVFIGKKGTIIDIRPDDYLSGYEATLSILVEFDNRFVTYLHKGDNKSRLSRAYWCKRGCLRLADKRFNLTRLRSYKGFALELTNKSGRKRMVNVLAERDSRYETSI